MDKKVMYALSYGLFVLTARQDGRDNGCVVNTVQQVTTTPNRICVAVNKANLTHDMVLATGVFNVSILTTDVPMEIFQHFGFQSGKNVDKFDNFYDYNYTDNGVAFLTRYASGVISAKVVQSIDLGTHTMFIADVTDLKALYEQESVTYAYYQANIKPKPAPKAAGKKGWRCRICGYVYEGDPLPADFVCPICKHGASDFEPL